MKKIDFHVHCFPDELAPRAMDKLSDGVEKRPEYDGTVSGLLGYMRENGIDKAVVCNIATNAKQTPNVNNFTISLINNPVAVPRPPAAGHQPLVPFGSIHPQYEDYKGEIDRLRAAGVRGLKFHPDYQKYFVDDPAMMPVYEYAAGKKMILLFHMGLDIGLRGVVRATPDRMINVVKALPDAKIVAAHMGGYKYSDIAEEYLIGESLFLDTSSTLSSLSKKQAERMIKKHGADKILFATDGPWFSAKKDIDYINSLNLSGKEKEAIFHNNAEKLLFTE